MIRKNIYSRITESIIKAHHDNNLDTAMEDGHEMENMGKKIVAIITADPDQDLDWESEYEPFGAAELTADDEAECCEHEGIEHDTCPSCGTDVDGHIVSDDEDDDSEDNDDMEDIMNGGGFESEDEGDEYEDMDVKDILVDILQELKGEDSDSEDEGAFETSDENPMFGSSSDDEESDDDDEDEDYDSMLGDNGSSEWETSDDEDDDYEDEDDYDEEEDFETPTQEVDEAMFDAPDQPGFKDAEVKQSQEQEEDEVYIFDALDNI